MENEVIEWSNLTPEEWADTELCKRMVEVSLRVFNAGGGIRAAKGKSTSEWRGKDPRIHVCHAMGHMEKALGADSPDITATYDPETGLPDIYHAVLRSAMAMYVQFERLERAKMRKLKESVSE